MYLNKPLLYLSRPRSLIMIRIYKYFIRYLALWMCLVRMFSNHAKNYLPLQLSILGGRTNCVSNYYRSLKLFISFHPERGVAVGPLWFFLTGITTSGIVEFYFCVYLVIAEIFHSLWYHIPYFNISTHFSYSYWNYTQCRMPVGKPSTNQENLRGLIPMLVWF